MPERSSVEISAHTGEESWGERLLPLLFAAAETCWVDAVFIALASIHFLQMDQPLLPLWAPFVLMAATCWLVTGGGLRARVPPRRRAGPTTTGSTRLLLMIAGVTLVIIWDRVYASSIMLFDPFWLLAILNDVLLLSSRAFYILVLALFAVYFCWRGLRLTRGVEAGDVYRVMLLGLSVFVCAILLQASAAPAPSYNLQLLLLIPLFLVFSLFSHALAHAIILRRTHPTGLQGGTSTQERALVLTIGAVCSALVVIALALGLSTNPDTLAQAERVLAPIGQLYNWLVDLFVAIVVAIVTPVVWLLSVLHFHITLPPLHQPPSPLKQLPGRAAHTNSVEWFVVLARVLGVVVPLLCIALLVLLIRSFLRRRWQGREVSESREEDTRESLWSWELFWMQLKALFHALFHRSAARQKGQMEALMEASTPGERSIREFYKAFLSWSANRGHPRRRDETPNEFEQRLEAHLPFAHTEMQALTDAYSATRYGDIAPGEAEVSRVQQLWAAIKQEER